MMFRNYKINPNLNDLLTASSLAFIVKLLSAGSAFLLNLIIARFLGAEQAGYFFLAQAVILFLSALARQGFDNALVRFIAGYSVNKQEYFVSGIYKYALIRIIPVLIILTIFLCVCSEYISVKIFNKPLLSGVLVIGALAILPISIAQLHGFCFQGKKNVALAMLFQSALLSVLALIIIFLIKPIDAFQAMAGYTLAAIVVLFISFFVWNSHKTSKLSALPREEKNTIKESIKPLFTILLLSQVTWWSGPLMLGIWSDTTNVAFFTVAQRTAMLTSFVLIAVNSIAAPKFAEAYEKNNFNEIREICISAGRITTLAALPFIILVFFFPEWLMSFFGADYVFGANILRILAVGQFINVMAGSVGYLLQMTGHEKILKNIFLISTFIMFIGCIIAIPDYGAHGAALVVAFSTITQNLLCVYQVKKKLGFNALNLMRNK